MTVHSAKGLEFPVVFVAALQKGIDSSAPVVAFEPSIGLGARWRNPAIRKDKDDLFQHALRERRNQREREESNRLLYVAMTRAEQVLVLSYSGKAANWAELAAGKLAFVTPPLPEGLPVRMTAAVTADPTEFLPPPTVNGQSDANATVTGLAAFVRCPRQYYLGSYLGFDVHAGGVDSGPSAGLSAADFGTQVHSLLAGGAVADPDPEALRLAEVFRKGALGRRLDRATRAEREFDFLMAMEDLVIHGQIDLWFEEGGELVIVDYKTDAVNGVEAHARAADYAVQLRLYAAALEKATGRMADRAYLHFLRPNTLVEVDLTPSLLESPEQIVRDFQDAQESMSFELREGPHCRRCQFHRGICPAA